MLSVTQSLAAAPLNSGQNASDNNSKRERRATQSTEVAQLLDRILQKRDNHGKPFAIVDKKNARVDVFASDGTRQGSSAVLLGLAKGDDSVPGIGERKMADIKPSERTTPAGRFEVEPGRNTQGEDIIWIDYDAAVSMHRVRTANKADRRLERLATPSVADNRISYGCINVPSAFYNAVLRDALGSIGGVVYVLPETRTLQSQFVGLMELKKP
ncbi:L,D-transpeptidase (plasmid) [Variovorax sp. PDNC026]|nr:L,D-transpeptidase [Variovorax sp. PMC12]QRY35652.1 L,D-transpeptidase [Variovorax sp. PDNC026]